MKQLLALSFLSKSYFHNEKWRLSKLAIAYLFIGAISFSYSIQSQAGWFDFLKDDDFSLDNVFGGSDGEKTSALTNTEMVDGLKEALSVGVERSISLLGQDGGYLNDASVRIPMPGALKSIEKGLRAIKQDQYADQFVSTMNSAAEKAIPRTSKIFGGAIKNMTLNDAKSILGGNDNAATEFFRRNTEVELSKLILPLIQEATDETGVTSSYKDLTKRAGILGGLVDLDSLDLDQHITDKALDGLFTKLALEERKIREDPLARSSDLLKKVFESYTK